MSRYPTFAGPNPSYPYDRNLLAHAPIVTRADRQAGYDIGIIERGVVPPAPTRGPNPFSETPTNRLDKELSSHTKAEYTPSLVTTYTYRWYKTKRGIAIIVLIALIVISIIVGVAVGVSGEKQNQSALAAATLPAAVDPSTVTPASTSAPTSPSIPIPSTTSPTTTNRPLSTLVPVTSIPTPSSPAVPIITPSTGTPRTALPSTTASSAPSASVTAGQGGSEGQKDKPWYCKLAPIFC